VVDGSQIQVSDWQLSIRLFELLPSGGAGLTGMFALWASAGWFGGGIGVEIVMSALSWWCCAAKH